MRGLKNFLLTLGVLLTFSFSILATQSFKEEDHKRATGSSISNTWGISEKGMEEAFETNEHLVCLMEFGGYFKRLNAKWKEVLEWEIEDLLNTPYYNFIHPDDMEKTLTYEKNFIPTGFTNRYRAKNGAYHWFSWIGLSNLSKEERSPSFAIVLDMTLDEILKQDSKKQIRILNEHTNFQTRIIKALLDIQQLYLGELGRYGDEKEAPFSLQYILHHFLHLSESEFGFMAQVVSGKESNALALRTWEASLSLKGEAQELFEACKAEGKTSLPFNALLDTVLDQKKYIIINDVQSYFKDKDTGFSEHVPSFKSFLGIPLTSKNELVGILTLVNRDTGYNELLLEWFEPLFLLAGRIVNEVRLLRFQQEIKEQYIEKEKAEAKSEAKSVFLAHMSHELRTPLSGLIGLLELINQEQMSAEDLNYLQMAKDTSSSLLEILNDILDLSKIEENKFTLETIAFSPLILTQEVIKLLSFSAKKKNLSLKLTTDSSIPDMLIGDPSRVRQILMNIVGNAIKFTEKGSVKVSLDGKLGDERETYLLSATVKDTGIGISPNKLEQLFQPFFQAEESMSRRFGGTGLGLYITKCLCEFMGGSINIMSTVEKGSIVHFAINLLLPGKLYTSKLSAFPEVPDVLPPLNILVVEDNPVNQLLIRMMLERSGCSVTLANNGIEALKAFEKGEPYDLILMDGQMPEMDGLEATKRIRQFSDLPIIGLTAHAMVTDKQRFLEAGMNGYLTKPVNKKALNAEIFRCLQERQETRT